MFTFLFMRVRTNETSFLIFWSFGRNINVSRLSASNVSGRCSILRFASKVIISRVFNLLDRQTIRKSSVQVIVWLVRTNVCCLVFANRVVIKVRVMNGGVRTRSARSACRFLNCFSHTSSTHYLSMRVRARGSIRQRISVPYPPNNT